MAENQMFTVVLMNGTKIVVAGTRAELESRFSEDDPTRLVPVQDAQGHLHLVNPAQLVEIRDQGPAPPPA
jgi:hypothetical protein